ncbi:MAG: LLM class flavin-dependent oxidoreductase, partial [Dehalococcoidia bacterium]
VQTKQGVPFDRPFGRMREYVQVARASHRGELIDHPGPIYPMQGFRCEFASVQHQIPIYLAALGPQMLRLAGEIADGALLNWRPPEFIPAAVEEVHQGARQAGRQPQEVDIACFLRVSVLSQGQPLPDQLRTQVVTYMQHPFYNKQFKDYGFGQVVREATQCLSQGDTAGAVEKVPDEMIRSLIAVGTPQQCWERIQQYIKAGVQTPVIAPVPIGPDPLRGWLDTINALADHLPDPALLAARG